VFWNRGGCTIFGILGAREGDMSGKCREYIADWLRFACWQGKHLQERNQGCGGVGRLQTTDLGKEEGHVKFSTGNWSVRLSLCLPAHGESALHNSVSEGQVPGRSSVYTVSPHRQTRVDACTRRIAVAFYAAISGTWHSPLKLPRLGHLGKKGLHGKVCTTVLRRYSTVAA